MKHLTSAGTIIYGNIESILDFLRGSMHWSAIQKPSCATPARYPARPRRKISQKE